MTNTEEKAKGTLFTSLASAEAIQFNPQRIKLNVDQKGFDFEAEGYSEDFLLNLVTKLKGQNVEASIVSKAPITGRTIDVTTETTIKSPQVAPVKPKEDSVAYSDPDSKVTLGEQFGDLSKKMYASAGVTHTEQDTAFHHTGIKIKNNKNHYRCGYSCAKCGNSGRHYIPSYAPAVNCHNCQTPLVVESATGKGFGESEEHRDEHGNYFIAEVIDYTRR